MTYISDGWEDVANVPFWWGQLGCKAPALQEIAMIALAQPASATSIRRINNEYAYVHDKQRRGIDQLKSQTLV